MVAILTSILSALGLVAKNVWTFAKAKVLLAWGVAKLLGPTIVSAWVKHRLVRLALILATCYAIQRVVSDLIQAVVVGVGTGMSLKSIIESSEWMGWLVWSGPLKFGVLWDQLLQCVSLWVSLRIMAYGVTRVQWFQRTFVSAFNKHF